MNKIENYVKILFEEEYMEGEIIKETLWAIDLGNQSYQIDNIPFYASSVAYGDIFSATWQDDFLVATDLLQPSENSTVRILFTDHSLVSATRQILLNKYGCESEISNLPQLIAVDIPASVAYPPIKLFLEEGEKNEQWAYEEACLSATHSQNLPQL